MADLSQVYLIIATLDIALITIAIGNYAISASFLGRETRLSRWRLEKRKQAFSAKLGTLEKSSQLIEEIKQEIERIEKEKKVLGLDFFFYHG